MAGKVESFSIKVPQAVLDDLRERLLRTRFPDEIPGSGWDYGTNLEYLRKLIKYWSTEYDWRVHEKELNRFSHFRARVDDLDVHFIRAEGSRGTPIPLLLLHGWPGSVWEFRKIIPMLTDGGKALPSFTVVAPSLPGYGFSSRPQRPGMDIAAIADVMVKLMVEVLGFERFGVQGGDWGAVIGSRIAQAYPRHVVGLHLNMVGAAPAQGRRIGELTPEEQRFVAEMNEFRRNESGYQGIQGTKPQTLAYALNDSPAGLCAWIVEKFYTWSDCNGELTNSFTWDEILTNVTIYWVTETINSSIRLYCEARRNPWRLPPGVRIETPTALAVFPKEIGRPPRSWVERIYNVQRYTLMPKGGHFAAMEEPQALADDVRAFFSALQQ